MSRPSWVLCTFLLGGCSQKLEDILLKGTLYDGEESGSSPLGGATLQIRDEDGGKGDSTTTEEDGAFRVEIASQQSFSVVFSAEGAVPTSFAATAGLEDMEAAERQLWMRSEAELADIAADFGDCGEREGASVEGTVYLYIPDQPDYHGLPIVTTAWVTAEDESGSLHVACYLDDEGTLDLEAEETGATGRFAIFGLPEGSSLIRVAYRLDTTVMPETIFPVWLEEGGTAPLYPALVENGIY